MQICIPGAQRGKKEKIIEKNQRKNNKRIPNITS
jgi:hypothetical protein